MTTTRKVNAHTNAGTLQAGDVVLGERTSGTTVLFTVPAQINDGDKGDLTVADSGATWTIDTPAVATVATDDKVLIKDTSASNVMKYVTAQSIADLATGGVSSVNGETGAVTITSDDISVAAQTNKFVTAAHLTILGNTSGTNTGDQTNITGNAATVTTNANLTGDVTSVGNAATIANDAVTYAKMQNISATDKLLGRSTAGAGDTEEIACTAAGRALLDDAAASDQRTTLGLGTLATQSGTFSGTSSGTNTGDQTSIVGITGTKAQFDTAVTDVNILYVGDVTQYTDEMAQDAVGGMVDTTLTYTDGTPLLTRAALTGDVIASAGSNATSITVIIPPTGRLTLVTATPVMVTDQAAKTTIYYALYTGNTVPIYDGTNFKNTVYTELSVATTDTTKSPAAIGASKVNDWFVWNDSGTIRLGHGPDWTNDTTRSAGTALVLTNGIYLNNASITNGPAASRGTYVGTTRSNASSQLDWIYGSIGVDGGAALHMVWNMYNRVSMAGCIKDSTNTHTYTTNIWRGWNNASTMRVSAVFGLREDIVDILLHNVVVATSAGATGYSTGIGVDTTSAFSGTPFYGYCYTGSVGQAFACPPAIFRDTVAAGAHYFQALEAGDNDTVFYGDSGLPSYCQNGMHYKLMM